MYTLINTAEQTVKNAPFQVFKKSFGHQSFKQQKLLFHKVKAYMIIVNTFIITISVVIISIINIHC